MGDLIKKKFHRMGARIKLAERPVRMKVSAFQRRRLGSRAVPFSAPISVDVRKDQDGEFFDVTYRQDVQVEILDIWPRQQHLLLMAREPETNVKSKFLCGHDERSWFVAAVPEASHATSVQQAMDALKPQEVWDAIVRNGLPRSERNRRHTAAFIRQGEWFFIPEEQLRVSNDEMLKNEPIRRGSGKPHLCQFLYRTGGTSVHVHADFPNGLTESEFRQLSEKKRKMPGWRTMVRDAGVYVKGSVRHPDHKTIWLNSWHRVVMNTETKSRAMRHVTFLD